MALGELGAILPEDERAVSVLRELKAEGLEDQRLAHRVGEMLLGARDGGDPHQRVVDGDAEVVDGHAVGAQEDEVAERGFHVPRDPPAHLIVDGDDLAGRDAEAVGVCLARVDLLLHLHRVRVAPLPVVCDLLRALGLGLLALRVELLLRGEAGVRPPILHQPVSHHLVDGVALRLPVVSGRSAHVGTLVPVQPEPAEVRNHRFLALPGGAREIRVLDADDELAVRLARHQVVVERSARTTNVQRPSRGGREAEAGRALGDRHDVRERVHIGSGH
mmetsp:Transcript_45346/g.108139  ORF Transcript_45346/g.108139 Transcript_45346/m.108139 type:complete len:275 (-) Transcript_45346:300-1124(-)